MCGVLTFLCRKANLFFLDDFYRKLCCSGCALMSCVGRKGLILFCFSGNVDSVDFLFEKKC